MNRIDRTFSQLKSRKKKAFIAFMTAGDPNLKATEDLALAFEKAGVDILELGVPFSDPLADGPTIQASSQRALKKGVNLPGILRAVASIRKKSQMPICLMTYYNPVYHYGEAKFVKDAVAAGVDGVIIPDLPPEEGAELIRYARKAGLATVFFLAPTTEKKRMPAVARASSGFIYYVSLTGVTGARQKTATDYRARLLEAKKLTATPVCVGFGVSSKEQVKAAAKIADGVIVGSAIVNCIARNSGNKNLVNHVSQFVKELASAC